MTPDETVDLLTVAAAFDQRTVGEGDAIAWHAAVGDLGFGDSRAAVIAHYQETTERIMPAHVRRRVRDIRDRRLEAVEIPEPPRELAANPPAWRAAIRAARTAIADGRDPAAAMQAVAGQVRRELEA